MAGMNLRESLVELMSDASYQPMTKSRLAKELKVPQGMRSAMRNELDRLIREGAIESLPRDQYWLAAGFVLEKTIAVNEVAPVVQQAPTDLSIQLVPKKAEPKPRDFKGLVGTLKFHPKGHAMFYPDPTAPENQGRTESLDTRAFINRSDTGTALDGDRVSILIEPRSKKFQAKRGAQVTPFEAEELKGKVEMVLERRSGRLVGNFEKEGSLSWVECDDKALNGRVRIIGDHTAQSGQQVVVVMETWDDRLEDPVGRIIEVLGWPNDKGVDIMSVIHRFGLHTSFPDEVLAEARAVPDSIEESEISRREDWRERLVITIDPADAKDHDDAVWCEKIPGGGWRLAVHIADVSHYIKPDSPMDKEAAQRGNSTYLVDRVLPMLPVELSNGLCSLKPNVDRLTKCAVMEISEKGEITRSEFCDAVIHSRSKLSYEQAQSILDGNSAPKDSDPQLEELVREAWRMASVLRRRRFQQGALDLEMPEMKIKLDHDGRAVSIAPVVHSSSHQLIEECMLVANEVVAKALREKMRPAMYRVHENPDPSRLETYTETARLHGYRPGDLTNRANIQKLLDASKGSPEEHIIKLGLLKSLKRAAYAAEPIGHYGLAKTDYAHFTSPIRRYADLVVHRALQPLLKNALPKTDKTASQAELREQAQHLSSTERTSAEAESETKQIKLLEYLESVLQSQERIVFDGLVTETRPMGLMVEVPTLGVRGVVKREDLPQSGGRWRFEANQMAWISSQSIIQMGMRVSLEIVHVNHERRFIDFRIAEVDGGLKQRATVKRVYGRSSERSLEKSSFPRAEFRPKKFGKKRY